MFLQVDFHENPNVGVYCRVNDSIGFLRKGLSKKLRTNIANTLQIDLVELSIADTSIIGSLLVMNTNGVIATDLVDRQNITLITDQGFDVFVVSDVLNAAGNDMLVNDYGGLVHPEMADEMVAEMEDILKVPLTKGTIAGLETVGMAAVATNKGVLCHPKVTDEEKAVLSSVFQVPVMIGTVNHGVPLIGSGLIANSHGFVVGTITTGIEMGRVEEALRFLDNGQ
jgi:translation initiation factor 6